MLYSAHLSDLKRVFFLSIFIVATTACTTTPNKKAATIDPAQVSKMQMLFDNTSEKFSQTLASADVASRIAANLVHVGYQISTAPGSDYSHDLTVAVGHIKHSATPVGFSFTAGDPDPRGGDFQKAKVLPITCTLTPRSAEQHRAEFTMDFSSKKFTRYGQQADEQTKLAAKLVDDMSTTCFNLLNGLKIKTTRKPSQLKLRSKKTSRSTVQQKPVSPAPATSVGTGNQSLAAPKTETVIEGQSMGVPITPAPAGPIPVPLPQTAPVSQGEATLKAAPVTEEQSVNVPVPEPANLSTNTTPTSITTDNQNVDTPEPIADTASPGTDSPSPDISSASQTPDASASESTWESSWMPSIIIENDPSGEHASDADGESSVDGKRKRIIIYNEGSPVIFQMGHER